jgi:hypothetical protein
MLGELFFEIVKYLLIFLVLCTFATYLFSPVRTFGNVHSRWHKTFKFQFSSKEFYNTVSEAIKASGISNTKIDTVQYSSSTNLFSATRTYLQVRRGDQMFLICAAPFADGFFVSWWMGEPINFVKDLIPRIPKIGPALAMWMYRKTFFMMDTDDMSKDCIRECIIAVVEKISNDKGTRAMTDLDHQPTAIALKDRFN